MPQAETGDTVSVHYTGKLDDGTVFDSSRDREPIEFKVGEQQVIKGFDDAVSGMEPGQSQTVTIASDDAYGERREELIFTVPKEQFPDDINPEEGQQLQMQQGEQVAVVTVAEVGDDNVTLDANHPLAGKDLTFDIELVAIK